MTTDNPAKKLPHRNALSAIFRRAVLGAALVLMAGCGPEAPAPQTPPEGATSITQVTTPPAPAVQAEQPAPAQPSRPEGVYFWHDANGFFERVTQDEPNGEIQYDVEHWAYEAEAHQTELLQDPANAALFQKFVGQFDYLRNASWSRKASAVNAAVNRLVRYTDDEDLYDTGEYFASGVETLKYRRGDCEDYAILKYYTLRALGFPDSRLYITSVNAEGEDSGSDHIVLLVDVAPEGHRSNFVMLENGAGVESLDDVDYSYYDAFNASGYWAPGPEQPEPAAQPRDENVSRPKVVVGSGTKTPAPKRAPALPRSGR